MREPKVSWLVGYWLVSVLFYQLTVSHEPITAFAADSTPSASVKSKLEQLKLEIASKAAKLKSEINQKLQNKAYIGIIKSKSNTILTLATRSDTKIVNITQDTVYEPSSLNTKKGALKEEDTIAALGDVDETGVLTARKIVKLPITNNQLTTHQPFGLKSYLWGQVISASDEIATIRDRSGKNMAVSVLKIDKAVEIGQTVIVTGYMGKNDIMTASFIFTTSKPKILPSPKESTRSATPSSKLNSKSK